MGPLYLPGVLVEVDTLRTETAPDGKFVIEIPKDLRSDEYKVWFFKKGYESASSTAHPQYGQDLEIKMKKN
jgi:hypothetical protein